LAHPAPRGHLVVGIPHDAQAFNDAYKYFTGHGGYFVSNNVYSRLVVLDVFNGGDIAPDLAEAWETPDDGQTWVFQLNRDARWHDGVPVTARDVAYTYTTVLERGYSGVTFLQDIDRVLALDDYTVEVQLTAPNAAFLSQLGQFVLTHIVARHLYDGTGWETNPHNLRPVGSGAFRFDRWVPGERIELVANESYWRAGPYLQRLTYRVVEDLDEALAAVERGDIHFHVMDVPCQQVNDFRGRGGADVVVLPGHSMGVLSFNWMRPHFQDRRVREAIARAIQREPIAAAVCPLAEPTAHHYLDSVDWAFNADATAPDFDLDRAGRLLDEAGYPPDSDGVRLRVGIANRSIYRHYGIAARMIAEQLARVGIEATTEEVDPVGWKARFIDAGEFDLLMDGGDIGPDPQIMAGYLASDGPRNVMRYRSDAVDRAFREGRATVDRAARARHYRALQTTLADDIARVPIMQHGEHLPFRPEWTGWSWSDGVRGTVPFWNHSKVRWGSGEG
jgi:peptide/nickel transport system substrate-binding protein